MSQHYLEKELNQLISEDPSIFQFVQDGSLDGLWYWDLQTLDDEWLSPRFWRTLGYEPDEKPHKTSAWQEIIFKEDLDQASEQLHQHFADPEHPYDQVVRYRHKDGHTVWMRCRGRAIRNEQGTPIRMLGVHNEITGLKEAQASLEDQNSRFANILKGTNVGTWEWNVKTGETKFNERWAEIIGYRLSDLGTTNIDTWIQLTHPHDLEESNQRVEAHFKGETDFYVCDIRMKHRDGRWVWIQDRGVLISRDEQGDPLLMAGSHIDITRQKTLEAELRHKTRLLEKSNEVARIGTWSLDLETNQLFWSKVTREIHEVADDFVPITETAINFYLEGADRDMITACFQRAVKEGIPYDIEVRITSASGAVKWVRSVGIPEVENGKCIRVYGVFQNVTARKESEIRNQNLLDVATSQNKRLMNFANIVTHNLRSHAANFKMLYQLMDLEKDPEKQEDIERHLRAAVKGLGETVDHLSEVTTMSNEVAEEMVPVDLASVIEDSFRTLSGSVSNAAVQVSIDVPSRLQVMAVRAYLDSIFNNLISNAIRYRSKDRTPSIDVSARREAGRVHINFTDNGVGIDLKKHGAQLFGMYKTFHKHPESKGIGLFIVKNQVEAMNGTITASSEVDRFTTFQLVFDECST